MKRHATSTRLAALMLAFALLLASCGGGTSAATMHLRKTEGTVGVSDGEGKDVTPKDDLGLYSGYQVGTQSESYAWIDLDSVKLTKMDANSEVEITKDGKKLEINVKSGNLFFNVTKPLAGDETMEIRTSSMMVGIRGTCGWVTQDSAALLEGTVSVEAGGQTATVNAGEMAVCTADGALEVKPFTASSVPVFVKAELEDNSSLAEAVEAASGIDVLAPVDPMHLRDMYTYSRSTNYSIDGKLIVAAECFPDEQGRIGRVVTHDEAFGSEYVTEYIYNEEGTLSQTIQTDGTVTSIVTENTADHRTIITPNNPDIERVYYYDEQGRETKAEYFRYGILIDYYTYTYDAGGKLIRVDNYSYTIMRNTDGEWVHADDSAEGTLSYYSLYEYN